MTVKPKTHFTLDTMIFVLFVVVMISGLILWFVLPGGGYQGGRNPNAGGTLLSLARADWRTVHNWAGLLMGILAALHLVLHLPWIVCQVKRLLGIGRRRPRATPYPNTGDICA